MLMSAYSTRLNFNNISLGELIYLFILSFPFAYRIQMRQGSSTSYKKT